MSIKENIKALEWVGTKRELRNVIDYVMNMIHEEDFPELTDKEFTKLFIEAFARNVVQAELKEMMAHIADPA